MEAANRFRIGSHCIAKRTRLETMITPDAPNVNKGFLARRGFSFQLQSKTRFPRCKAAAHRYDFPGTAGFRYPTMLLTSARIAVNVALQK